MWQYLGKFICQIYANNPLQFNVFYGVELGPEPELEFKFCAQGTGERKKFVVSAKNLVTEKVYAKKEFQLEENLERLTEEFALEPHVEEIVGFLKNIQNYL